MNFIDFEKAFDSIDRDTLWKLLRHYGIPPKIVTLIQKMYDGTSCKFLHEGRQTGVRQGCLLSPFLFILAVDWLMKESTSGSRNGIQWTLLTQLDDLDFADDIALVSHNHSQMQDKTSTVNQLSGSIGLRIHPGKPKILKIKTEDTQAITVGGKPLEVVENFTYLGSVIDHSVGTAADVRSRVAKARAALKTLDKIWRDRTISTKTKIRLFNSNVKYTLLYGCETWSLNKSSLKKVQTFVNGFLRRILHIFLARKNSKRGIVEQSRTAPNPGRNNTEKMEMARAHSQKAKKQHYNTILAVEPSRQTEQGKTTDNMEKKFGRGDEGKWSLMEGHYTDGSG